LVPFCQFTVVHFDLISNIFLCGYARRNHRMKLLTWCRVICVLFSLLGLIPHVLGKATAVRKLARDGVASKRSITHAILGLF